MINKTMPASVGAETSIAHKDIRKTQSDSNNIIIAQKFEKSTNNFKTFENIFTQAKNTLDIRQVLEYYGLSVNGKGFSICPFHQEETHLLRFIMILSTVSGAEKAAA